MGITGETLTIKVEARAEKEIEVTPGRRPREP
jgi:hypothetical protein